MSDDEKKKVDEPTGEVDPEYQSKSEFAKATGDQPRMDFEMFLISLATNALMAMGEMPDESGSPQVNLMLAKQTIDILDLLQQKTEGNLTPREKELLQQNLFELRMRYVAKAAG